MIRKHKPLTGRWMLVSSIRKYKPLTRAHGRRGPSSAIDIALPHSQDLGLNVCATVRWLTHKTWD